MLYNNGYYDFVYYNSGKHDFLFENVYKGQFLEIKGEIKTLMSLLNTVY